MKKRSVPRSGVIHQNPHLPLNYFVARLDRLVLRGRRYARRVAVCPTQIGALRGVSGPSGGALRDVPPNVHARAARDRDRRRLLSLPPCGADLRESVLAHARTCPNLIPPKPLARMASVSSSTIPPAVSERFAARRRIRLG